MSKFNNVNKTIDLVKMASGKSFNSLSSGLYSSIVAVDNQLHDMKTQLRANEHRLDLLQKENEALKSSLETTFIITS